MPGFVSLEKRSLGMHAQCICWVFQGPERDTHGRSKPQSQGKFQGAPVSTNGRCISKESPQLVA